jgi:DNA-binding transcriptional ArsR family regulator
MAIRFFRGRIDFDKLSMAEISEVAASIAVLEKLSEKDGFDFESGPSRKYVPRTDMAGKRSAQKPKLQQRLLLVFRSRGSLLYVELEEATGMKMGSVNPHLSALFKEGLITKRRVPREGGERGRNSDTRYELSDEGIVVADELIAAGVTQLS